MSLPIEPSSPAPVLLPLSWADVHRDTKALAWQLKDMKVWQGIIAVTRGGLIPAGILAQELDIRIIETVCIASYDDKSHTRNSLTVLKGLSCLPRDQGNGWLIIDDLADTGTTATIIRNMFPQAHLATIYAKPTGRSLVDTFVTEISQDTWIVFPWEI